MGENIKYFRKMKLMTQQDLAEKLGCSRLTIIKMEKDKVQEVGCKTLLKLAEIFGITMEELMKEGSWRNYLSN